MNPKTPTTCAKWVCPDCGESPTTSRVRCGEPGMKEKLAKHRVEMAAQDLLLALVAAMKHGPHASTCSMRVCDDEESCDCWRSVARSALKKAWTTPAPQATPARPAAARHEGEK